MFTIFSCSINVTVTSQNGVPSFHLHQRSYMWWGNLHTSNDLLFMVVALKWLKTSKEILKWKFYSIWTSILHEVGVDLTSMCWKNTLSTKTKNSGNSCVPCD